MESQPRLGRLLLTGAAGGLGQMLRQKLKPFARTLRVSDREALAPAREGEEVVQCDLADREAVLALTQGVDAVAHFGGVSVEGPFDPILQSNIVGVYNLYEAARKHGVKRVVFASSNHVVGFRRQDERIDADAPVRPDGYYGVSKAFGENLSRFYFDRYGIETACLRIGSSFPTVRDRRMLATYLSYDDLVELVRCALFAPKLGHTIVFGASDNSASWWDNSRAAHLGFRPRDSADAQRARVEAESAPLDPQDPARIYQGGVFVRTGPFE
ncbi:MAG TPA: NAD(P)-dependent oxidoreductase [Usitatibacter sp.]|nr:NAD(P)-dependent oxidoreductase [Usitatibacter sp.]